MDHAFEMSNVACMKRIRIHLGKGFVSNEGPQNFWWPLDSSLSISKLIENILEGRGLQKYKRSAISASLQDYYLLPGSDASILRDEDLLILEASSDDVELNKVGVELGPKRRRLAEEREACPSGASQPPKLPSRSARRKAAKRRYKRLEMASKSDENKTKTDDSLPTSTEPPARNDKFKLVAPDLDKTLQDTRNLESNVVADAPLNHFKQFEYEKLALCKDMPLANSLVAYRLLEPGADGMPKASNVRTALVLSSDKVTGLVTLCPCDNSTSGVSITQIKADCGSHTSVSQPSTNLNEKSNDLLVLDVISFFDIRYITKNDGLSSSRQRKRAKYSKLGPPKPPTCIGTTADNDKIFKINNTTSLHKIENILTVTGAKTVNEDVGIGGKRFSKGRRSRALQTALGPLLKLLRDKTEK